MSQYCWRPANFSEKLLFFSLPGEVFLITKKKKVFSEKFAGRQQYKKFIAGKHHQHKK
jgi:hypothetical protein